MLLKDNQKIKLPIINYELLVFEMTMIMISSIIVLISLYDLVYGLNDSFMMNIRRIDLIVVSIFALDLIINFVIAKEKIPYIKKSIITILCVVPFSSFFRIAAMFRLNRVFHLLRYTTTSNVGIFSNLWMFFMKPSVIRVSKFLNLARSYFSRSSKTNTKNNLLT